MSVAAYGAPSKAPVLTLAGIDESLLPYTVDLSAEKEGRRCPPREVPIFSPEELIRRRPQEVVVLTWDIVDEVAPTAAGAASGNRPEATPLRPPARARYVDPLIVCRRAESQIERLRHIRRCLALRCLRAAPCADQSMRAIMR